VAPERTESLEVSGAGLAFAHPSMSGFDPKESFAIRRYQGLL